MLLPCEAGSDLSISAIQILLITQYSKLFIFGVFCLKSLHLTYLLCCLIFIKYNLSTVGYTSTVHFCFNQNTPLSIFLELSYSSHEEAKLQMFAFSDILFIFFKSSFLSVFSLFVFQPLVLKLMVL